MEKVFAKIADLMLAVSEMSVEFNDAKSRAADMEEAWRDAASLMIKREEELVELKERYDILDRNYNSLKEEYNSLRAQYAWLKSKHGE